MARLTLQQQLVDTQQKLENLQQAYANLQSERNSLVEQRNNLLKTAETQQIEIVRLREQVGDVEKLKKELESAKNMQNHYSAQASRAESELEQCHAVLDGVDGAPAREYDGEYGKKQRTVVTRLAGAFLSIAKTGGAK